jgi:hypothetical protein
VSGGLADLNLHNGTNQVYAIWVTTNLLTDWQVALELWPTNPVVQAFTVPTLGRDNLFVRAEDWTGVDSNGDGLPDWWIWNYYGELSETVATLDGQGNTLGYDYTNHLVPGTFGFSAIEVTNNYVRSSLVPLQLDVTGHPYFIAMLVDDTNFAEAVWNDYTASNLTVNLGLTEGGHDVCVGLRGHGEAPASAIWRQQQLNLDFTAPTLVITSPASSPVSVPLIQIQGYADEPLSSLLFDVSNATGIFTNQQGFLAGQFYDTNLLAFTTNWFACSAELSDGTNLLKFHGTDWAGNTGDLSFEFVYFNTNPPVLTIVWPQPNLAISGNSFTLQAQVDDPAAKFTASIVDASGDTNTVQGLIERSGSAWAQNLPLNTGTNSVTVTVTGANGGTSVTNFNIIKNDVGLVIYPLENYQLNQSSVSVFGEIGDTNLCVWVNGIQATVNSDGTWEADSVPVSPVGTANLSVQIYIGDPVLVASQNFYQAQPVTVGLMSYSGRHELGFFGNGTETINWSYKTGGNYYDSYNENFEISSNENGVAYIDFGWLELPFDMPWECAAVTTPQFYSSHTYSYGNYTQTRVMVEPSGQVLAGTTNLYLILANASEFSTRQMEDGPNYGTYGWKYENLVAGIGSVAYFNGYLGDTPLPPEWLQINGKALINSGITNSYSIYDWDGPITFNVAWGQTIVAAPAGVNWDVTPIATNVYQNLAYTFNVQAFDVTPRMLVDIGRTGNANQLTTPSSPYRFWINDSQEHGDDETSGGADDQIPGASSPNYSWNHPQGRSDYVNFFPVTLSLSNLLDWCPLTNGFEYHLSQADGAVKIAYTDLAQTNAFGYLTNSAAPADYGSIAGYDPSFSPDSSGVITYTTLDAADLVHVTASGLVLNTNWLNAVQASGGCGVILMEGCAATTQPLLLEVWGKDSFGNLQKLGSVPLYLNISGVEQMFRHLNLSAYGNGTVDVASRTDAPNEPDTLNKNLVFLHGYNVNQQQARGVESEMFKRFYWSGSKAKFYGVTWNGSVSQGDFIPGISCNLQTNVVNAFLTAPHLASFLGTLSGDTTVAAHSLGNMVALSAISDYHAAPNHYFMIDSAVSIEAVQGSAPFEPAMIPSAWQNYSNRTFASDWWRLFSTNDSRCTLTWSNRLGNLGNVDIYNFYSSGEEVLREDTDDPPPGILSGGVTQLINIWAGVAKGAYAWVWQEKGKGNALYDNFVSSTHGGWRFPVNEYGDPNPVPPSTANSLPDSTLQQTPVFDFGSYYDQINGSFPDLALTNASGSTYAQANRDRILSDAIPALTLPVGANFIDRLGVDRNVNMQTSFETGWPLRSGDEADKWHHSDFDYVAYPFTHKLFEEIVNNGNLK